MWSVRSQFLDMLSVVGDISVMEVAGHESDGLKFEESGKKVRG